MMKSQERFNQKPLLAGILALFSAIPVAFVIYYVNLRWSYDLETAVKIVAALLIALGSLSFLSYLFIGRKTARIKNLGLWIIGTVGVLLAAIYFFQAAFHIFLPADIVIWSEGDFVNDILKFRQGYPIFSAEINNESFTYTPGTQLITYFLAWISGNGTSIVVYRVIQVIYTILAAIVAFFCCRRLARSVLPHDSELFGSYQWGIVWLVGLFLIATNSLTNPFTHLLHNDALAQLVTVTGFWLLLEFDASGNKKLLWLMVLVPAISFWVKQSLIIFAILYLFHLVLFTRPRSVKTILAFAAASFGLILLSFSVGYWFWQENFVYWCFTVLGAHSVSPLRSLQHLLDIWEYFAIGLLGGLVLLQSSGFKKLLGPWIVWLVLISIETYTSGVAWMLNHSGPGSLVAGIWFWAALAVVWTKQADTDLKNAKLSDWIRIGVPVAMICLLFSGMGFVRIPVQPFDYKDAIRYIKEIETEFEGEEVKLVLLDQGTWVYVREGVIMKDRAPTIGERGYSRTGDFSGVLDRLNRKSYSKIILRNFHSSDFSYEHELWSEPSGIRKALNANYREVRSIEAVNGFKPENLPYGFRRISILVPKKD